MMSARISYYQNTHEIGQNTEQVSYGGCEKLELAIDRVAKCARSVIDGWACQ